MFDKVLRLFIFLISLWYFGENGIVLNAHKAFMAGIGILFFVAMSQKPKRQIRLAYPSLFFGYCVFNFIWWKMHHVFFPVFISIFFGGILFYLVCQYSEDFKGILKTLKVVILINLIMVFLQKIRLDPIFDIAISHLALHGFFERTSSLSALLILGIPAMPILMIPLLCLPNFSGIAFGSFAFMLSAGKNKGLRFIIPILLIIGMCLLWTSRDKLNFKYEGRKDLLFEATQVTLVSRPLFGSGLGAFQESNLPKKYDWDIELKCEPIEWLFNTGLFGLLIGFLWIRDIFKRFWRYSDMVFYHFTAILGFSLMGLTQGVFQNPKLMAVFLPILAWFYIRTEEA